MSEQMHTYTFPRKLTHPKRRDIFLHFTKTSKLISALSRDRRISLTRKVLFFGTVLGLLAVLLFPDFFNEVFLSIVLPFAGTVLGVPLDLGFDWIAFAIAVVSLLRIFPAEIVAEHYQTIFHAVN